MMGGVKEFAAAIFVKLNCQLSSFSNNKLLCAVYSAVEEVNQNPWICALLN